MLFGKIIRRLDNAEAEIIRLKEENERLRALTEREWNAQNNEQLSCARLIDEWVNGKGVKNE